MKFAAIADTHGKHKLLALPAADVLIHAGDISMKGTYPEIIDFLDWFAGLDFKHKIFIAGNHDFYFEKTAPEEIAGLMPPGVIYLNDSGTSIDNIHLWGSPVTPWFFNWAFNRHRGAAIKKHWDLIPSNTDIVISHGPAYGIQDKTTSGELVGCKDLFEKVTEIKPSAFICGHIHEAYGNTEENGTRYINASVLNERYRLVNAPVVFEL